MSNDGTADVIEKYADRISKIVREPDDGIYDALNKGISHATGDVIGFLHADDLLAKPSAVRMIADRFAEFKTDAGYGDLLYVDNKNPTKTIRYWKSRSFSTKRFYFGWMPPHPTCYIRRECYEKFGGYRTDMSISADYELLIRMMVKEKISASYIDDVLVHMRVGGKSNQSLRNRRLANSEDATAWRHNQLKVPFLLQFDKPLRKVSQFFRRPPKSQKPNSVATPTQV